MSEPSRNRLQEVRNRGCMIIVRDIIAANRSGRFNAPVPSGDRKKNRVQMTARTASTRHYTRSKDGSGESFVSAFVVFEKKACFMMSH